MIIAAEIAYETPKIWAHRLATSNLNKIPYHDLVLFITYKQRPDVTQRLGFRNPRGIT